MFAKYKVFVNVNSENPNVLSTLNDLSVYCDSYLYTILKPWWLATPCKSL